MAYERLNLGTGALLDKDVFKHIDDSFEYLYGIIKDLQERIAILEGNGGDIVIPETITITDDGNGNVTLTTTITDDDNGNVILTNVTFTNDGNGNVTIN